jgi:hypothetical protein
LLGLCSRSRDLLVRAEQCTDLSTRVKARLLLTMYYKRMNDFVALPTRTSDIFEARQFLQSTHKGGSTMITIMKYQCQCVSLGALGFADTLKNFVNKQPFHSELPDFGAA